jgi:hypothetical protein
MIMQRFSRLTAHRHTTIVRNTINTPGTHQNRKREQRKWSAALLGAVMAVASMSVSPASDNSGDSLALQGHAKRYMRINEYLFHGTQKTTAIAQRIAGDHRHRV